MKKPSTFRLDAKTCNILASLANKTGMSRTEIIEKAVKSYAEYKLKTKKALMNYARSLNAIDADQMLDDIYSSRINTED
jgi:hypothetical protein